MPGVLVIRCESALLYFNVEHVRERLFEILRARPMRVRLVVFFLARFPKSISPAPSCSPTCTRRSRAQGIDFRLADPHGEVRDALRRIGFEQQYGPLESGQTVDLVVAEWQASAAARGGSTTS